MGIGKFGLVFLVFPLLALAHASSVHRSSTVTVRKLTENVKFKALDDPENDYNGTTEEDGYDTVYIDEDGNEVDYNGDNINYYCTNCDDFIEVIYDDDDDDDDYVWLYVDDDINEVDSDEKDYEVHDDEEDNDDSATDSVEHDKSKQNEKLEQPSIQIENTTERALT